MALTRRQFLRSSGLGLAYASLPFWLSACAREAVVPAGGVLATPETIATTPAPDNVVHLLNRLTYGPRPGDVGRVTKLGWDAFIEQQLHPEQIDDSALERR